MHFRVITAAVSAAVIGSVAPAAAMSILIDDFDDAQRVADLPQGGDPVASQISGSMIGGWRDLYVDSDQNLSGGTELVARSRPDAGGTTVLEFNNATDVTGRAWVTYDGSNPVGASPNPIGNTPGSVNTLGLGDGTSGVNLLIGPENLTGFLFDIFAVDQAGLFIEIRAWEYGAAIANAAVFSELLPAGGGNPFVPFAAFEGASIDWSNVGALQFFAQTGETGALVPALDGAIDRISVEVIPLPAPALLLLGGLGGLGALRLRKRKA
jgi:hypothetical protein